MVVAPAPPLVVAAAPVVAVVPVPVIVADSRLVEVVVVTVSVLPQELSRNEHTATSGVSTASFFMAL